MTRSEFAEIVNAVALEQSQSILDAMSEAKANTIPCKMIVPPAPGIVYPKGRCFL